MSEQELIALLHEADEIESEYNNFQLVVKANCNSIYGSSGSRFFSLYSPRTAEDITRTGKHFTVLIDRAINNYFKTWNTDPTNLEKIQAIYPEVVRLRNFEEYVPDTANDLCCYGDTDSRYIRIDLIYQLLILSDGKCKPIPDDDKDFTDFVCFLDNEYFSKIIKSTIAQDCSERNATSGFMKMAHEVTARKSAFIKKKKYIMNVVWSDGKLFDHSKLKFRGIELKKGSMSDNAKKLLEKLVVKFIQKNATADEIRKDCIKIMQFIRAKKDKELIYQLSTVSGLSDIRLENTASGSTMYVSDRTHIQIQIALSWMNFIRANHLEGEYQPPFEGQKMQYYYCNPSSGYKVIGIPDNIDISTVKNLPEPDWNRMAIVNIVKPLCRYILEKSDVSDSDVENFLIGLKTINSLF